MNDALTAADRFAFYEHDRIEERDDVEPDEDSVFNPWAVYDV